MFFLEKLKISSMIKCLIDEGYDKITAQSLVFLTLYVKGYKDFSDFKPIEDGIIYTSYVNTTTCNFKLPRFDEKTVRNLAIKIWKKITNENITLTEEESKLLERLKETAQRPS